METFDSALASRIAGRLAGTYPLEGTYHEARLRAQLPGMVQRAGRLVEAETGLRADGEPVIHVVTRSEWADTNLAAFSALIAPAHERLTSQGGLPAKLSRRVIAAELGAVLGLLGRRVLGQYELVLPTGTDDHGDTMLFVGANLLSMERANEFRPDEFRFWVALHECTHRLQFLGVPWLRGYFMSLVSDLVAASQPEPGRLARVSAELREAANAGEPIITETGLFGLFASPDQRGVIERVQALMSLLEGHGHVVMDRIGERELVTQRRMSRVLQARRQDPRTAMFMRIVGLEMKLRQYELGARFIEGVERHASWETLDRAWEGPEQLPTLDEIENPVRWLERVA